MKYKINVLSIYEKGHYRDTQEDSVFPKDGQATADDRLFMVCDGMGGHEAGEVASQAVCEAMSKIIQELAPAENVLTDEILGQALTEAYNLLDERDPNPESAKKMGTTMTLLKLHEGGATIAHIGDSRVYQFRYDEDGKLQVIHKTVDHSLVNDLLKVGELTEEEAENFPRKNVITRAMQSHLERRPKADISHIEDVRAGDYFLLCSDGILEHTSDQNLCYMIGMPNAKDERKIQMLKDTTDDNHDNHSAYLIHILEANESVMATPVEQAKTQTSATSPKAEPGRLGIERKSLIIRYLAAGITATLVIGGAWIYTINSNQTQKSVEQMNVENSDSVSEIEKTATKSITPTELEKPQSTENSTTTPPATNTTDTVIQTIAEQISVSAATNEPQKPEAAPVSRDTASQADKKDANTLEAEAVSDEDKFKETFKGTKEAAE